MENHGLAVLQKRSSSELPFRQNMEQKQDTRRNSCHLKNIKQEEKKSRKQLIISEANMNDMGAEDLLIKKVDSNSNTQGDTKTKERKRKKLKPLYIANIPCIRHFIK